MRVHDIMTPRVETIEGHESVTKAAATMLAARIHQLVVKQGRKVIGVIGLHDAERAAKRATVADAMSTEVVCATPDMTVQRAAALLRGHAIGSLPVLDHSELVGIVTISDMLDFVARNPVPGKGSTRSPWKRGVRPQARHVATSRA